VPFQSPIQRSLCRSSTLRVAVPAIQALERRTVTPPPTTRLFFASAHSIVDFSNGASVAALDVLHGLCASGFESQAFCAAKLDFQTEVCLEKIVDSMDEPHQIQRSTCRSRRAQVLYTRRRRVPITLIRQDSTLHVYERPEEVQTVLEFFQKFLDVYRPGVMLTYGGDPITTGMIAIARERGVPVVFAIHNFAYKHIANFSRVDYCIVPSEFAPRHYRERIGLDCRVLPNPVDWERVRVQECEPSYVTFVNPSLYKGAYPFVRIAQEPGRRRPDIPLLVVGSETGTRTVLGSETGTRTVLCANTTRVPVSVPRSEGSWHIRLSVDREEMGVPILK
jgi:hypothetical protein